jgi:hypothetical protein
MKDMSPEERVQPFDEKAALAELERLRESIQAARRARQRTSDEFETFIKSFRTPAPISDGPTATPRPSEASRPAASEPIDQPLHSSDQLLSTIAVPSNTESSDDRASAPSSHLPRRYRLSPRLLAIPAIIAVIGVGLVSIPWRRETSPPRAVNAVSDSATPTRNVAASPPAVSQPAPASPVRSVAIELRVIRPVWMRVVVDGRTDVEGTVQPAEPLHFTGDRSIVVRVGNGGDVVVKTGSREEPFGDTGQPRTRTFSKP